MTSSHQDLEQQINDFLEARKRRPRLVKVIDELESVLSRGRDHIDAWSEIHSAFTNDDREIISLAGWFFMTSAVAHLHAAALHAAKLTENHKDSVNVWYLLRLVGNESRPRRQKHEVKRSIRKWRDRLDTLEEDIRAVKEQRDHYLAHVDRSTFNSGMEGSSVEAERLVRIFDGVREVLRDIGGLVRGTRQGSSAERNSFEDLIGPRGLGDLLYFARISVRDAEVPDPSIHSKRVRDLERSLREVQRDVEEIAE